MFDKNLKEENQKLKIENEKLRNITNTQNKIIKNYEKRKKEYQNIIVKNAITLDKYLKKRNERIKEAKLKQAEEDEEEL